MITFLTNPFIFVLLIWLIVVMIIYFINKFSANILLKIIYRIYYCEKREAMFLFKKQSGVNTITEIGNLWDTTKKRFNDNSIIENPNSERLSRTIRGVTYYQHLKLYEAFLNDCKYVPYNGSYDKEFYNIKNANYLPLKILLEQEDLFDEYYWNIFKPNHQKISDLLFNLKHRLLITDCTEIQLTDKALSSLQAPIKFNDDIIIEHAFDLLKKSL